MSSTTTFIVDDDPGLEPETSSPINRVFNYHTLSTLLRVLGSGVLVASLSMLLFRGWDLGTDMSRYYTLVAYSGILAAVGLVIGKVVQENKGARTFLALAVCSVVVNYTVLGAMMYSIGNETNAIYPAFANWTAPGVFASLSALAVGLLILTPITYFAFSVFARQSAKRFTVLYVIANLALVFPVRSSVAVGFIALALVILVLRQIIAARRTDSALATREGHFVIAAQFLPVAILLGRNFYFYAADEFMLTLGALIVYAVARQIAMSAKLAGNNVRGSLVRTMQVASSIAAALGCAAIILATKLADELLMPIVSLVFSGLLIDTSLTSSEDDSGYRRAAAVVFATSIYAQPVRLSGSGHGSSRNGYRNLRGSVWILGRTKVRFPERRDRTVERADLSIT
ncbi:MAG: hypothetical protein ACI9BW_001165 [Gammaproteobacteria bacterium]|jgi:hypothetical protein